MNAPLKTFVHALKESPRLFFGAASSGDENAIAAIRDDLERVDWTDLIKRLTLYTTHRLRGYSEPGRYGVMLSGGNTPEDFVLSAIESLYSGRRRFDATRTSLFTFLCGVISSEISHLAKREGSMEHELLAGRLAQELAAPDETDARLVASDFADMLLRDLADDPAVQQYAQLSLRLSANADIATALSLNMDEIRKLDRRLRRRLLRLKARRDRAASGTRLPDVSTVESSAEGATRDVDQGSLDAALSTLAIPSSEIDAELRRLGVDVEATADLADTVKG
jgi:hypothetical protein